MEWLESLPASFLFGFAVGTVIAWITMYEPMPKDVSEDVEDLSKRGLWDKGKVKRD